MPMYAIVHFWCKPDAIRDFVGLRDIYDAEVKTRFVLFFVVSICIFRRESPYSFNGFSRLDSFVIKLSVELLLPRSSPPCLPEIY